MRSEQSIYQQTKALCGRAEVGWGGFRLPIRVQGTARLGLTIPKHCIMSSRPTLLLAVVLAALASPAGLVSAKLHHPTRSPPRAKRSPPRRLLAPPPSVDSYRWVVTVGPGSPDGFLRPVVLVNGERAPTLTVTQGNMLEVSRH